MTVSAIRYPRPYTYDVELVLQKRLIVRPYVKYHSECLCWATAADQLQ